MIVKQIVMIMFANMYRQMLEKFYFAILQVFKATALFYRLFTTLTIHLNIGVKLRCKVSNSILCHLKSVIKSTLLVNKL